MQESCRSCSTEQQEAECTPAKLRIIVKSGSLAQERTVLNDTLSEATSLSAWKSKMAQKLRTEQTCFSYAWHPSPEAPARPLDTEADLEALKACYRTALQRRSGEGAAGAQPLLRMLVSLDSSSRLDCSQSSPVVLTRSRSRSLDVPSKLSSGTPGAGQCARATQARPEVLEVPSSAQETQQRNNPSPSAVRVQKKHRVHQPACTESAPSSTSGSEISEHEVCWANVLRSIVLTVDRHHFGSKLAAARASS